MRHVVKPAAAQEPSGRKAAVRVRVSGFAHQSVGPGDVVVAVGRVPNFHLAGLNEIAFLPEEAAWHKAGVQAVYFQAERCIRFLCLPPLPLFYHVLYHEIGHHVFALVISSKVKTLWVNRIASQAPSVSAYGAICPQEDFAEAYAMYLSPEVARGAAAAMKLDFMRQLVFSGDPWTLKERHML